MEAKELRIGNFVNVVTTNQQTKITAINKHVGAVVNSSLCWVGFNDIKPIPLSEEWMKKIMKYWNCHYSIITSNPMKYGGVKFFMFMDFDREFNNPLLHVHQLQNLHFALTEEELLIK